MNYCFKLHNSRAVTFPNECFVCGAAAEKHHRIKRFQLTGMSFHIFYLSLKNGRMKIDVPVCKEHHNQLLFLKLCFWLIISAAIYFLLFSKDLKFLTIFFGFVAYLIGRKYFPTKKSFRIYSIDGDGYVVYSSNREEYILKLCELNDAELFIRDFSTGADY